MSDKISVTSSILNSPLVETKLFGEVPLSDSENNSRTASANSFGNGVEAANNARNTADRIGNGVANYNHTNGNTKKSNSKEMNVAVIDIDEGKSIISDS